MTTISPRTLSLRQWFSAVFAAWFCLGAAGCATTTYRATDLPLEYAAKPIDRLDKADLSRLTSYSVRSNQIGVGDLLEVGIPPGTLEIGNRLLASPPFLMDQAEKKRRGAVFRVESQRPFEHGLRFLGLSTPVVRNSKQGGSPWELRRTL